MSVVQSCLTTYSEEPVILFESLMVLGNVAVMPLITEMLVARGIVGMSLDILTRFYDQRNVMLSVTYLLLNVSASKVAREQILEMNGEKLVLDYYATNNYEEDEEVTTNVMGCMSGFCEDESLLQSYLDLDGCNLTLKTFDRYKSSDGVVYYCVELIVKICLYDERHHTEHRDLFDQDRVRIYYECLETFKSRTRVIVVLLRLLALLAKDPAIASLLVDLGIAEVICDGFSYYEDRRRVLIPMMQLATVVAEADENKQVLLGDDVVRLALASLDAYRSDAEVVAANLEFHMVMSRASLCYAAYEATGCVELTLDLLAEHQEEVSVCRPGLLLLLNLAARDTRCERYNNERALKAILSVLRIHGDHELLQTIGCQLLEVLCSHSSVCGLLIHLEAVHLVCAAVNQFVGNRVVQVCGNNVLSGMMTDETCVAAMLNHGVIYTHVAVLGSCAEDEDVQTAVLRADASLCDVPMGCTSFFNEGGLLRVFAAMNRFRDNAELLSFCCDIISHCLHTIAQDDTFPVLLHNDCMKLVLDILDRLHAHVQCQNSALGVLREMMLQPEYQSQFVDCEGPAIFERSILNERMLDTAARSVVMIMHSLTQSAKMCKSRLRSKLLSNVIAVVELFPGSKRVNKSAAVMWEMATRNKELANALLDTELIPSLVRIMNAYRKNYVQAPLMQTYQHLLAASEKRAALLMIDGSVVEACATSLKAFTSAAEVVRPCVDVLITLIGYEESYERMLSVPLLPDLVTVIAQEGQSESIQNQCVVLLEKLMFLPGSKLSLRSVADVRVLVGVIRVALKSDKEILGKALRIVIRSLRLVNLYENIRSSSLAEVVCEVVLHVNDEETQEQCMEVMSLLVANSEATHEVFTRRDVVSIVVDNMRVCFQNRLMNESCCMALAFLTRYSEVVDYVSMVSIAKLVMESMRHYKSSKNVMYCALCVTNISVNESCCKELIENEAVQTLLSLCDGFMTEEDTLGAITSALYCLSLDERSHAIFGASRCVEVFTQVMGMWTKRTNDEILCNIFLVIFNCYKVRTVLDALRRSDLLDLIISVTKSHFSKSLAKAFVLLCSRLAEEAELRPVLVQHSVLEPLLDCVRRFPSGRTINSKGFAAMELLSSEESVRQDLLDKNVLSDCLNALSKHMFVREVVLSVLPVMAILEKFALESGQEKKVRDVDVSERVIKVVVENGYEEAVLRAALRVLESFLPFDPDGMKLYSHDSVAVVINSLGKLYEEEESQVLTLRVLKTTLLVPEASDLFEQNEGVNLLIQVVATFYSSFALQLEAMEVISKLAETEDLQSILFENQALNYLVNALTNFEERPEVLLPAEYAILKMCDYEPVCQTLFDLGAVVKLVNILKRFPDNANLVWAACCILDKCKGNEMFIPVVSKLGIVELVLDCLERMCKDAEVLCVLLKTLYNLVRLSDELSAVFQSKNGPELVSKTWEAWEKDASVTGAVLRCVTAYAGVAALLPRLMSMRYVERIIAAMETFDDNSSVLRGALTALAHLAPSEAPRKIMLEKDVIALATRAMGGFPDKEGLLVNGAVLLKRLFSEEVRKEMESSDLVATCVKALALHGVYPDMINAMCGLLELLVSARTYPQLKEQKALSVLMDCLSIHLQDVDCCTAVMRLLKTVLFIAVEQGEGVSTRIIEVAVFMMNNYPDSEEVQKLGIELLEAFVSQEGDMVAFLELGGLDAVVRAMHGESEYISASCCKLLFAASKTPVVRDAIVQVEGVSMLLMAMSEYPKSTKIHQYAAAALANLVVSHEVCKQIIEPSELSGSGLELLYR